ncbi:unnamed protein product, partial [marine sediment metagenome]
KAVKQMIDDFRCFEGMVLEQDIFIAAGRKDSDKDEQLKTAAAPVLAKINLHLFPKGKFRNFRIGP